MSAEVPTGRAFLDRYCTPELADPPLPVRPRVDAATLAEDLGGALVQIRAARVELDRLELAAVEAARGRGWRWEEIATVWGLGSRQAVQQRVARLRALTGGTVTG